MIAVVTDSTAQVPVELGDRLGIHVAPCGVVIDGEPFDDGSITAEEVSEHMQRGAEVTTSAPTVGTLLDTYRAAAEEGAEAVVSVHITAEMSSTLDTARLAAASSPVPVTLVDARSASFGTGLCAWAAASAAWTGGDLQAVVDAAETTARSQQNVFVMDLATALRSGRVGGVSDAQVRAEGVPVLALRGSDIEEIGRVASASKAAAAMADYVAASTKGVPVRAGVGDLGSPEVAEALRARVDALGDVAEVVRYEVAASVAVHAGGDSVGVFFAPLSDRR